MRDTLRSEDKSLTDDEIEKRVENIMTGKFSNSISGATMRGYCDADCSKKKVD